MPNRKGHIEKPVKEAILVANGKKKKKRGKKKKNPRTMITTEATLN